MDESAPWVSLGQIVREADADGMCLIMTYDADNTSTEREVWMLPKEEAQSKFFLLPEGVATAQKASPKWSDRKGRWLCRAQQQHLPDLLGALEEWLGDGPRAGAIQAAKDQGRERARRLVAGDLVRSLRHAALAQVLVGPKTKAKDEEFVVRLFEEKTARGAVQHISQWQRNSHGMASVTREAVEFPVDAIYDVPTNMFNVFDTSAANASS